MTVTYKYKKRDGTIRYIKCDKNKTKLLKLMAKPKKIFHINMTYMK